MDVIALSLIACVSLISLTISSVSLWLHRTKPGAPDVSTLSRQLHALELSHADLVDKTAHWQRRNAVRKMREAADESPDGVLQGVPGTNKDALRARIFGGDR